MNDAALAVIGTGSVGSMALWKASQTGAAVLGFDAQTPAHSRSAVGGDTRLFRTTYRDQRPYYPLLVEAESRWRELESDSGARILNQCGGLYIGADDGEYLPALRRNVQQTGAKVETLDRQQMAKRYPQHTLQPDEAAILDPRAGFLRTDAAVTAAAAVAESNGATILLHHGVNRLEEQPDGILIHSGSNTWKTDKVIIAAGAGSQGILPNWLSSHVEVRRIYLTWFAAQDAAEYRPEAFPIFAHIHQNRSMYGTPTVDGATVKATLDGRSMPLDPDGTLRRELTPAEIAESEDTIAHFLPGLRPSIVRSDAYPDLYTTDHVGLLGYLPDSDRIYCATGFSGIGFKKASTLGTIAAEECLTGNRRPEAEFMRPGRFAGDGTI